MSRLNRFIRSRIFLYLIFTLVLSFGLEEVVDDVFSDLPAGDFEVKELDQSITMWLSEYRSPELNQIMTDLTALGSVSVLAIVSLAVTALLLWNRIYFGFLHLLVAGLGAMIWPEVLKDFFGRERPDSIEHLVQVSDLSFPSGHAFGSAVMYITFALLASRWLKSLVQVMFWSAFAGAVIGLVGLSRIYLGVHHPTDVIGGFCAGGVWAFFVAILFELFKRENKFL